MKETGRERGKVGLRRRRQLPSPALILSMLALFVALGGTATALKGKWSVKRDDIAPKAVGTKQIGDRSVTAHKLHADSVRTTQISDKAVGPWKLRLGSAAVALGEASTTSKTPVDLGGPTATVQVPGGGLVAIQAEAAMRATGNNSARVYLYEPTSIPKPVMIHESGASNFQTRFSTPGVGAGSGVTNRVRAGWIVMPVSAGTRTFQLRYATTGGTAIFKNRVLRVAVIR
ncbi:MAG: hypothetical protein KDB54_12330 [Solirubrobacterales bacterium]|nr:hypothetical protein [Solirubrobacterales bacterium]MCB0861428.1 hypothetical protein [Solirubrobacterales bacterium]